MSLFPSLAVWRGVTSLIVVGTLAGSSLADVIPGWDFRSLGQGWQAGTVVSLGCDGPRPAIWIGFPGDRESHSGDFAAVSRRCVIPANAAGRLHFAWKDDFLGPTAGFHFAQVLVDDAVVWQADVAGGDLEFHSVSVDLPKSLPSDNSHFVFLRVLDKQRVTNFGVRIWWSGVRLELGKRGTLDLMPEVQTASPQPIPADLPLAAAEPLGEAWLRRAIVLQPWGDTQHAALTELGDRPRRVQREFGFNAIIVLPPAAHNAITTPRYHLTEAQFRSAIEAYRAAGYKLILYSSVMHCGHAPEWQGGELGRKHPDWAQRDAEGNAVMDYGAPWLCPSTSALEYTVAYTENLVRAYQADAVMLDNNEFFRTARGWTCYCQACQRAFRQYARQRCGDEGAARLFGIPAQELKIPIEPGPLYALWIHWRNRVWAETNEIFRARLRRIDPHVMFFANTAYQHGDALLASDLQYDREDVLLSESRGLTLWGMSQKMLLGRALAAGRPLWNYIGTFAEENFHRLRPAGVLGPLISSTLAHGAQPWIVYYGFHDQEGEPQARAVMARLLAWFAARSDLFAGQRWANAGVVVSLPSRNLLRTPLLPSYTERLLNEGVPLVALREDQITAETLRPLKFLVLDGCGCLEVAPARAIADWVRAGGRLVATPDAGWYDELGRMRTRSVLQQAVRVDCSACRSTRVGRGEVAFSPSHAIPESLLAWTSGERFQSVPPSGIEIVPYRSSGAIYLHFVRHEPVTSKVRLFWPRSLTPEGTTGLFYTTDQEAPREITVERTDRGASVVLDQVHDYGILVVKTAR